MKWRPATKEQVIEIIKNLPNKPLLIRNAKPWKSKRKQYTEYRLYITIPKEYKDKNVLVIVYDD